MGLISISSSHGVQSIPIEDSTLTENQENDYDEVLKHQKEYTKLLSTYVNTTKFNLYTKIFFKILFFLITMLIMLFMVYSFHKSVDKVFNIIANTDAKFNQTKEIIDLLAILVPPVLSLLATFIIIPKVIAKYLFNIKEESSMVEIINNLQIYDDRLYNHRYKEEVLANQKYLEEQTGYMPNIPDESSSDATNVPDESSSDAEITQDSDA